MKITKGTCCQHTYPQTELTRHCTGCSYSKSVLIVGGITKFKTIYKDIVEGSGWKFEYLDGYMKGGDRVLDNKIKKCDVILCPIDCNSHNACLSVKKLCKKHGKPYQMLASSSVSGITQAIKSVV